MTLPLYAGGPSPPIAALCVSTCPYDAGRKLSLKRCNSSDPGALRWPRGYSIAPVAQLALRLHAWTSELPGQSPGGRFIERRAQQGIDSLGRKIGIGLENFCKLCTS